jgi:hypothetical protein
MRSAIAFPTNNQNAGELQHDSPSLSQLRLSPLRLQQGLFASLALMVTLIAGQQLQHWQQSPQQAPSFERPVTTQTHFSSIGSVSADGAANNTCGRPDSTLGELPPKNVGFSRQQNRRLC